MRKFVIHIFKEHDWVIVEKKYAPIDMERSWGRDNDLENMFGVARVVNGKIIELMDAFCVKKEFLEKIKKDSRFTEIVEFECYVVTEKDKKPFEVKKRFTGTIWQGVEWVNKHYR